MRRSSRFAGLSVPFVAMWISAFFGPAAIGFTVCCASVFLAGVAVIRPSMWLKRSRVPVGGRIRVPSFVRPRPRPAVISRLSKPSSVDFGGLASP